MIIDVLSKGDCFGEIGFVTGSERTATVVAADFVMAIEIRARLIGRISPASQILFQRAFLDIMARCLTRATQKIADLRDCRKIKFLTLG
jgi:CRP-like cAMP-binding protein